MSETQTLMATGNTTDDTGEWRPFKVWAAHVKDSGAPSVKSEKSAKENWDPYAVWKRQVRR